MELSMIPQEKSEAVIRGLREAFGVSEFEDIRKLNGGQWSLALVFRIVVRGRPYLLRIIMRQDDPTRHFASMRMAADAGLAPQVWYASVEDKLSITDFVEAVPFPVSDALVQIPAVLRRLHALPPFGRVPDAINTSCMFLLNEGPARDGFLQKFRASNLLPHEECEEFLARYAAIAAAYPMDDPDMVSSHNDLFKPDNILFDGERVWLVDWEAAFLNDRYADLAVVANLVAGNEKEENVFLNAYFGQDPNPYQLARFFLIQQLAHIFYTMAFLYLGSLSHPVDWNEPVPDLRDFHRRMWAGAVDLTDKPTKILYGRAHLKQLRQTQHARFDEAVRTVRSLVRRADR
jgi:aminoglycoside phosphotransferase (APT) family kinase protein